MPQSLGALAAEVQKQRAQQALAAAFPPPPPVPAVASADPMGDPMALDPMDDMDDMGAAPVYTLPPADLTRGEQRDQQRTNTRVVRDATRRNTQRDRDKAREAQRRDRAVTTGLRQAEQRQKRATAGGVTP